jgi:hypothetical protein
MRSRPRSLRGEEERFVISHLQIIWLYHIIESGKEKLKNSEDSPGRGKAGKCGKRLNEKEPEDPPVL